MRLRIQSLAFHSLSPPAPRHGIKGPPEDLAPDRRHPFTEEIFCGGEPVRDACGERWIKSGASKTDDESASTRPHRGTRIVSQNMQDSKECAAILSRAKRLLVLTGAGISAESGMPTYRGPNGAYATNSSLPEVMSAEGFANDRDKVWQQIEEMRIQAAVAEPNIAHQILAKWEREQRFDGFLIATQNIDGLHQKAGSERLSELHGSLWQIARPRTIDFTEDDQFSDDVKFMAYPDLREEILRRWSEENQQHVWTDRTVPFSQIPPFSDSEIRPNVLLFNESYGSRLVWVEDFINSAPDTVLVIGCSGGVALLPRLLKQCRKAIPDCAIININPHEDCIELPHHYLPLSASVALTVLDSFFS